MSFAETPRRQMPLSFKTDQFVLRVGTISLDAADALVGLLGMVETDFVTEERFFHEARADQGGCLTT
jgi:hypothetical protein